MKLIFVTGTLGSGKTTLLIHLLGWMRTQDIPLPPVIVNDRGTGSNLDYVRVTSEVEGVMAEDLLGQCIGCGGREEFLAIVRQMSDAGHELIIVEPTGLFTLDEMGKIADQLNRCSIRSIHLIPATEIQAATAVGIKNMGLCRVIGLTHAHGDVTSQVDLLQAATSKPVVVLTEEPDEGQIKTIWDRLTLSTTVRMPVPRLGVMKRASHVCTSACTHDHHQSHEHHHEGEPHCTTFSTEGWTMGEILGYLLGLGDNLVRFKGVAQTEDGLLVQLEWAHGSWSQRPAPAGSMLKADIFTRERVDKPDRIALTDQMIQSLVKGITPVLVKSPTGGYATLDSVGPTAWELLYEQSKRASVMVQRACGLQLVGRCREATNYLLNSDLGRLDPRQIDYVRLQTSMVWLWWNQEFRFRLEDGDREFITQLLQALDPEQVDTTALQHWMGETHDYLPRLIEQFPDYAHKIVRVQERIPTTMT